METPPGINVNVFTGVYTNAILTTPTSAAQSLYDTYIGWDQFSSSVVLSVEDIALTESIRIYPNPVQNTLSLEIAMDIDLKEIVIYNILGKQVLKSKHTNLNITNLTAGIYILKLETTSGTTAVKRFIKE